MKVGLVGYGAIGSKVAELLLAKQCGRCTLVAVLVHNAREAPAELARASVPFSADVDAFYTQPFDVLVEAAGQGAVSEHGLRCIQSGRDLFLTSIGALTDEALYGSLRDAAEAEGGGRLLLCSGSMPGLDWLSAATMCGIDNVSVTQQKPHGAWAGTPAEAAAAAATGETTLAESPARVISAEYPKNANVASMLALCTAGLDDTVVRLSTVPGEAGNRVVVHFEGAAGEITINTRSNPSLSNPKTSMIVPFAVAKGLRNLSSKVVLGI